MPDLGQVPDIDVPSYLPDLPGVADDLMYSADLGPGIAPSAPGAIPELPTFHTEVTQPFKPGGPRAGDGLGWALPCSASCLLRYLTLDFCPRPRGWGEIKRRLLLGRKVMTNLDSIFTRAQPPAFPRQSNGRLGFPGPTQGEG